MDTVTLTPSGRKTAAEAGTGPAAAFSASWELLPDLTAAAAARRLVRGQLAAWELSGLTEEALLITSELVTNALVHTQGPVTLTLRRPRPRRPDGTAVRIEVRDEGRCGGLDPSGEWPAGAPEKHLGTGGRGLHLVDSTAEAWGNFNDREGHTVWAGLRAPDAGR
ncbi:ATP-binding protein [Streptomyces sp. CAU 1734]|uniref:ATP-binding protein n=1 Tax=Streptomyces sp. CAU 1734 TaxID=3140360 RepID=UPI00326059CC